MRIEVDGVRYGGFLRASAEFRLDALCGSFEFEATSEEGRPLPFVGGEPCAVIVDDELVLTGFIEIVNVDGDSGEHRIVVAGRDKTCDVLDSSISSLSDLRAPISLARIARRVVSHLGADVQVTDAARPAAFDEAEDLASPEPGQNAFEFLEALARKRRVLLTSGPSGDLVIAAPSTVDSGGRIVHKAREEGESNNVLAYSASYDQTNRFRRYVSASQRNLVPLSLAGVPDLDSIVDQGTSPSSAATDPGARAGRQLVIAGESMFSDSQDALRAKWEADVRKARGRAYGATVHGYRNQAGRLWRTNELVRVDDDFAGIASTMLVNAVRYSISLEEGRTTTLSLLNRNAYTLELEEPADEEVGLGLAG